MQLRFGRQSGRDIPIDHTGEWDQGITAPIMNPEPTSERPMGLYYNTLQVQQDVTGRPNTELHWANDKDLTPITFARFATRWGDVQLKNGLANGVGTGKIWGYRGEGWLDVVMPTIPGQSRRIGGNLPGNYPAKGPAPSQVQNAFNAGPGSQPQYPGGPGQVASNFIVTPAEAMAGGG